jgi:two-component system NtrC family sensor kinase
VAGIQGRLTLLFVVIVTLVLAVSGSYAQYSLAQELEAGHMRLRDGVLTRLQTSLPAALWDLDKAKVNSIVRAEMLPPELQSIRVDDTSVGLFVGMRRDGNGNLVGMERQAGSGVVDASGITDGKAVKANLLFDEHDSVFPRQPVQVGTVTVTFSHSPIEAALAAEMRRKLVQVLVLDAILVAALALSLRIVFKPLQRLRDGMFDLATRGSDEAEELPEHRHDELGEVIRGFNAVQRKLKSVIARIREAEDEARRSQQETTLAMDNFRKAQESLLQADRLASLGSLVAGVAHEINTPVGITLTSASVLKEATDEVLQAVGQGAVKKSDITRYLATAAESSRLIMDNAYRAAHMIQSFKQIAVDQVSEAQRQFELREYVSEVVSSLNPRLKKNAIKVKIECPPEIVLDTYPGALAQVLTNLVLNCVDHAFDPGQGGRIVIGARCDGPWVVMQVADNGKGIPADLLGKVFDPFVTTRRGQGGTGLGLNIVFNLIAKQFGGTITVSSTVSNTMDGAASGTVFTLRIPGAADGQAAPPGAPLA